MKHILIYPLCLLSIALWSYNAGAASLEADLPPKVKQLRDEIRKKMVTEDKFDIGEYQNAPVLPEDSQMRDACFGKAPQQEKMLIPHSNDELKQQSTLATDMNTVIGSVGSGCGSAKATQRFSVLDLNKWYLTSMLSKDDNDKYYRGALYRGDTGFNPETGKGGNELLVRARLVRPDETMLNSCAQALMVQNAGGQTSPNDPVWMRRELDNCLNQYILQHGRFPRINENHNATYFGINAGLCQPLKLQIPPSRFDRYEYAPSEYMGVAWNKLLVDASYKLRQGKAKAEPDYEKHSKVRVTKKIEMPKGNFGQILVEDLAESKTKGGQVTLDYEKILDPSHPFSPRWDYEKTDRSLSQDVWQVTCGNQPIDILKFREGPFESAISKNINSNRMMMLLCTPAKGNVFHPAYTWCSMNNFCSVPPSPDNNCCSVDYRFDDKVNPAFRKMLCGMPIVDACNFIGRPVTPINTLKMREVNGTNFQGGQAPEGYTFKEYFGEHKPYMRCWDSNTECGERSQLFSILGTPIGASGILPISPASFAAIGITNPADISKITNSGISPTALQGMINGGAIGNLSGLVQGGLSPAMLGNIGNISNLAAIPNASQITGLIGQGGISPASLSSLAGSSLSGLNISALTNLTNVPSSMIQQVTAMPTNVVQGLSQTIQSAAGSPEKLVEQLQAQGVTINSSVASQMIGNSSQLNNAITGGLPAGITGGINPTQLASLAGLSAGGLNPSQIASALPQMQKINSALSTIPTGQMGQLSSLLGNPTASANLSNLNALAGANGLGPAQMSNLPSLLGNAIPNMPDIGSNISGLSSQAMSAISNATSEQLGAITGGINGAVAGANGAISGATAGATQALNQATQQMQQAMAGATQAMQQAMAGATQALNQATAAVNQAMQGVTDAIANATQGINSALEGATAQLNQAMGQLNQATAGINAAITNATSAITAPITQATQALNNATAGVNNAVANVVGPQVMSLLSKKLLYNPVSTKGANYAIMGAGREGESCMIGGGKGEGGIANPDPITSWSELKLYYVRSMRMNVKCIANHEKLFKYYSAEDGILRMMGAQDIPIRERDDKGKFSRYYLATMAFPWLGYVSDPRSARQFPNISHPNVSASQVGTGLDGALPNDIVVFNEGLVRKGDKATDRFPFVGQVMNANNDAVRAKTGASSNGFDFISLRAMNYGKYLDVCGNSDMAGDSTWVTMYKDRLPSDYIKRFSDLGSNKNTPPSYHCLDPYLSACIEPLWSQVPRYQIKANY